MTRVLNVWWDAILVGTLRLDAHGEMSFAYASDWLAEPSRRALSFSLPLREAPFSRRECRPFFDGLLPEEAQLETVARLLGVSRRNDFRLLEALGGDVAGALTIWPEGDAPTIDVEAPRDPLDDEALVELLDTLPRRPLLAGRDGLRLSLAGAQSKLPVVMRQGRVALPAAGQQLRSAATCEYAARHRAA